MDVWGGDTWNIASELSMAEPYRVGPAVVGHPESLVSGRMETRSPHFS